MNLLEFKAGDINGHVLFNMKAASGIEIIAAFDEEQEIIENDFFQDHLQEVNSLVPSEKGTRKQIEKLITEHLKSCYGLKVSGKVEISALPEKFFKRLKEKTLLTIEGGLPIPTGDDE